MIGQFGMSARLRGEPPVPPPPSPRRVRKPDLRKSHRTNRWHALVEKVRGGKGSDPLLPGNHQFLPFFNVCLPFISCSPTSCAPCAGRRRRTAPTGAAPPLGLRQRTWRSARPGPERRTGGELVVPTMINVPLPVGSRTRWRPCSLP